MKSILRKLLIICACALCNVSYGQITTSGISKILHYEPFDFFIDPETVVANADTLSGIYDVNNSPNPGWAAGASVSGQLTLDNHWDNSNQTDYVKTYSYVAHPVWRDNFIGLWNDKTTDLTFAEIDIKDKQNLAVSFALANKYASSAVPPIVSVSIDGGPWTLLTATGFGTEWPTLAGNITFTGIILPLSNLTGNSLSVNFKQSSQHNQIDDFSVLGDDAPPATGGEPTPVAVTVYNEPFNLSIDAEFVGDASTLNGFATGASVSGPIVIEPYAYTKSYPFSTVGTDDFVGFWGDKTTDITFSGINIANVSDLAISFGLAQKYMSASAVPNVEISIDGGDWLRLTHAGNGTTWGETFFDGTFTGVSLPVKYGTSQLTGNSLSIRFHGSNGGQIDDLKVTGTTVPGVPSTTPGTTLGPKETLFTEAFAFNSWNGVTLVEDASTLTGLSSGATAKGPMIIDNAWDDHYSYAYKSIVNPDNILALWTDKAVQTDVTFSGINISNYSNLAFSFGLAQDYGNVDARPQVFVSVDGGSWIPLTTTGNGTQWPTVLATNDPVTFVGITLPLVDQNGNPLTGNSLSFNIKSSVNGYGCQMDDISVTGNALIPVSTAPGVVSVTGITVTSDSATVVIGHSLQCSATVLPADANIKTVVWSVTNQGGAVGFINSVTGLLDAAGVGLVTVTASATDGSGVTGSLVVTIVGVPSVILRSINITPSPSDALAVVYMNGGTLQMAANVLPKTAADTSVTWSVVIPTRGNANNAPAADATIDEVTGLLTGGITPGPIYVVATANDASGVTDTVKVIVARVTDVTNADQSQFTLSPNPATTGVYVSEAKDISTVEVFDLVGLPVPAAVYSNGYINVANIPSGTYVVKISSLSGKSSIKKIVKY